MHVCDFMDMVKRESRYGSPSVLTDQATLDILASIILRRARVWAKWSWPWSKEPLSFTVGSSTDEYAATATSGNKYARILVLVPKSGTTIYKPLIQMEEREFYDWFASQQPAVPDAPTRYINTGLNASGIWTVKIWPKPESAFTIFGSGKKNLAALTIADVTGNTEFDYFPDGIIEDVLFDGVLGDAHKLQGNDAEGARLDMAFEYKLKQKVQEQVDAARDDTPITSPVPDMYRHNKRARGGTSVA